MTQPRSIQKVAQISVFTDEAIEVHCKESRYFALHPKSFEAQTDQFGEDSVAGNWIAKNVANNTEIKQLDSTGKLDICLPGIDTCHSVFIQKVNKPELMALHVSAQSTRRGYDVANKKALEVLLPDNYFNVQSLYGAGPSRADFEMDNKTKPAYIDCDSSYYGDLKSQVGLTDKDEIDVVVVHAGIEFSPEKLIERLQSICSIRSINIIQRDRKKLTPEGFNQFYNVHLSLDEKMNSRILIKSDADKFYEEVIENPFNTSEASYKNLPFKKPIVKVQEQKTEEKYLPDTIGSALLQEYGAIPFSLNGNKLLHEKLKTVSEDSDFWQTPLMKMEIVSSSLDAKSAVLSILIKDKQSRDESFKARDLLQYIPAYKFDLDLSNEIIFHAKDIEEFKKNYHARLDKGWRSDIAEIEKKPAQSIADNIVTLLKNYLKPKTFLNINYSFTHHDDIAREMLEVFEKNPKLSLTQINNYLTFQVNRLETGSIRATLRKVITGSKKNQLGEEQYLNRNGSFFQILLYGIHLCRQQKTATKSLRMT